MMRLGAVAAGIRSRGDKKGARRRSPSEEEVELYQKQNHTEISDIDIRENSKTKLRFRKLPWTEWLLGLAFFGGALFIFLFLHFHQVKKITNLGATIVMVILVGIGCFCLYEGKIESVIFDRKSGSMILSRTDSACNKKQTFHVSFCSIKLFSDRCSDLFHPSVLCYFALCCRHSIRQLRYMLQGRE